MKLIKEINNRGFELNDLAGKMSPQTTVEELNYLRKEIDSLRVIARGLRVDPTAVDMVEMTFASKLHQMFQAISPKEQTPPPGWFDNHKYWICN